MILYSTVTSLRVLNRPSVNWLRKVFPQSIIKLQIIEKELMLKILLFLYEPVVACDNFKRLTSCLTRNDVTKLYFL